MLSTPSLMHFGSRLQAERQALLTEALLADYGLPDYGWLSGNTLTTESHASSSQASGPVDNPPLEPNVFLPGLPDHHSQPEEEEQEEVEEEEQVEVEEEQVEVEEEQGGEEQEEEESTAAAAAVKYFDLQLLKYAINLATGRRYFAHERMTVRSIVTAGSWLAGVNLTPPDLPLTLVKAGWGMLVITKGMAAEGDILGTEVMESVGLNESGWEQRIDLDHERVCDLVDSFTNVNDQMLINHLGSSLSYIRIMDCSTADEDLPGLPEAAPAPDFADTVLEGNVFFNVTAVANHFNPDMTSFSDMLLPTPQNRCLPGRPGSCAVKALLHIYGEKKGEAVIIKSLEDNAGITVGSDGAPVPMTARQLGEQLHAMGEGCQILRSVDHAVLYETEAPRGPRGGTNTHSFTGLYQDNHLECINTKNFRQNLSRAAKKALLESLEEPADPDTAHRDLPKVLTRPSPDLLPDYGLELATTEADVVAHIKAAVADPPTPTRSSPKDVQHSRLDIICAFTDELFDTMTAAGLRPTVKASGRTKITKITIFTLTKPTVLQKDNVRLTVNIYPPSSKYGASKLEVESVEQYREVLRQEHALETTLLNKHTLSILSANAQSTFETYQFSAVTGMFDSYERVMLREAPDIFEQYASCLPALPYLANPFSAAAGMFDLYVVKPWDKPGMEQVAHDVCKQYPSCLAAQRYLARIDPDAEFLPCLPGHRISRYEWYLIFLPLEYLPLAGWNIIPWEIVEQLQRFGEQYHLPEFQPTKFIKVHQLSPKAVAAAVKALFASNIPEPLQKMTAVVAIGKANLNTSQEHSTHNYFANTDDALAFLRHQRTKTDGGLEKYIRYPRQHMSPPPAPFYFVQVTKKKEMMGSFLGRHQVMASALTQMLGHKLQWGSMGFTATGMKTDCLYMFRELTSESMPLEELNLKHGIKPEFGHFRQEDDKWWANEKLLLRGRVNRVYTEYPNVVRQCEELGIEEETWENVQAAIRNATGNILLLGGAGTGKTDNALKYCCSGGTMLNDLYSEVLVVTSFHSTRENRLLLYLW